MLEAILAQTGAMSSVESNRPRFGVMSDFFHGIAFLHVGSPLRFQRRGAANRREDNHVVLRAQIILLRDRLRADVLVGIPALSNA